MFAFLFSTTHYVYNKYTQNETKKLLRRIGYDTEDPTNSVHHQFMRKYEDKIFR